MDSITQELEVKTVPFLGVELMAARDADGQIWAGVRWMCDGIGLSEGQRKRQIANIQTDAVLAKGDQIWSSLRTEVCRIPFVSNWTTFHSGWRRSPLRQR